MLRELLKEQITRLNDTNNITLNELEDMQNTVFSKLSQAKENIQNYEDL